MRVTTHGKSFLLDGAPFPFRGVSYPAVCGAGVASNRETLRLDLAAIATAGYTAVSIPYRSRAPIEHGAGAGLGFMLEFDDPYLLEKVVLASRRERQRIIAEAATRIRHAVRAWDGTDALLGVAFGRGSGGSDWIDGPTDGLLSRRAANLTRDVANELAIALHDEDQSTLAAWRSSWPLDGGCPPDFDFLIVDFCLSGTAELRPALMASHCEVGDRPLVLGSVSITGPSSARNPEIGWLLETAVRCGAAGTIARSWPPTEGDWSGAEMRVPWRTVRDLDIRWPPISVVVAAYNAESTLEECLSHCDRLEYPQLEVIVVDDGSTDATARIARTHPRVRLLTIPHAGLTVARNAGYRAAHGELIAYLDRDAYPSPEWPWYLALAALDERVGGSGGPNVPPPDETASARVVARSPGGPVPQLLAPDRARHLPGCNMAFWKTLLEQLDGFDPVVGAGDDIELEWRVIASGHEMGYHPAALVWHHRRPGLRPYLRQQSRNGRGQALLERRYPERFARGYRVRNAAARLRPRRSGGVTATACPVSYLTLPRDEPAALELAHQWGIPAALALGSTAPLALVRRRLAAPATAAAAFIAALLVIDVLWAREDRRHSDRGLRVSSEIALFRLLRPLAFRWGHLTGACELRRAAGSASTTPAFGAGTPRGDGIPQR